MARSDEPLEPPAGGLPALALRTTPRPGDIEALAALVAATGVFHAAEAAVARELLEERIAKGESSYRFVFADAGGRLVGYAAFGLVPLTQASFDLYWIAVHPDWQGRGVGRELLAAVERAVQQAGGGQIFIETSAREAYGRTRSFYALAGYAELARFADFYAPNDAKVVYGKRVAAEPSPAA